jgi:hypothetical protein
MTTTAHGADAHAIAQYISKLGRVAVTRVTISPDADGWSFGRRRQVINFNDILRC